MRAAACVQLTNSRPSFMAVKLPGSNRAGPDKLWNIQSKAEFYGEVLTIVIDGKEEKVKVQAVQRHVQAKTDSHRLRSRLIAIAVEWQTPRPARSGAFVMRLVSIAKAQNQPPLPASDACSFPAATALFHRDIQPLGTDFGVDLLHPLASRPPENGQVRIPTPAACQQHGAITLHSCTAVS